MWELKLYFYPSAGGFKKTKTKGLCDTYHTNERRETGFIDTCVSYEQQRCTYDTYYTSIRPNMNGKTSAWYKEVGRRHVLEGGMTSWRPMTTQPGVCVVVRGRMDGYVVTVVLVCIVYEYICEDRRA